MKPKPVYQSLMRGVVAAAALAASGSLAQSFPSRPIELVVHTSPGGGTDIIARVVAEILTREKLVGQPVNVMNRPGGAGAIGSRCGDMLASGTSI